MKPRHIHLRAELIFVVLLFSISAIPPCDGQQNGVGNGIDADQRYRQHIKKLQKKLPGDDFTILIEKPFVVIGDETPDKLKARCNSTVKFAVDHLKKQYFKHDPEHVIDIWLFKDKKSYEKNTMHLFGEKPNTPFGYYSSRHRALVMNISTGGGTLVHEIVHPFVETNFPNCPSWFNEGLASLYEQCAEQNHQIWGLPNWRLRGLKQAIRSNSVPTFESLCKTTKEEFYRDRSGINYAQARYLCLYLQEKRKLNRFYKEFCKNVNRDPSGYDTLLDVLGRNDMGNFKEEWESFVLKLEFP